MDARKLLALTGAAVMVISVSAPARAQEDVALGGNLAREVCSECHAVELGDLQSRNPDALAFQALANTPGMNAMTIKVWLLSPHRTMPLFVLSGAELEGVSAYILSLEHMAP
ncbi:MAG: mono/diheme cytochrome c family protein [Hyphomicrobiaceae bacterium]|jgi:mono/diheme cytochrome c family protein